MKAADELGCCAEMVERACAELVTGSPAGVECCAAALEAASERMRRVLPALAPSAEALAEAWRLRRNLRCAGALLENAAVYHGGWRRLLAAKVAGYTPDGSPGPMAPAGRIWLEA